ncbi:LysR family transcriptional regulator, glycine cleavage system transcriptional activator [Sulfitobacter brevis]|uniref:LysR family transcriptional regulator, glycine cleavage system transcriptional activator n=1 Tax=Sulfitobacter brevis TaxID=74348 RepID=A0A1I2F587_9RHOB|nr:LysR substrate-binding domain-containing protein [Sulfitobacter brevis]SFF00129.1 LysR family transcriptional regulator, glycine cleavage system transcriptional activator [Sulfitobacter brevis]
MGHQIPPLPWLRAFEASARHLSFTNAASELNLTQAAISKQVKLLEHYFGEPLFERLPRSLILTKAGAAYQPKANDVFERLAAGTLEVFGGRRMGILSVRAPVGFATTWLAARLVRFLAAHPKIQVRIVSSVWAEDYDSETFDLDIRYGFGKWTGFDADRLTLEKLIPMCLPEVAAGMSSPDDLAKERLLHVLGYQEGWAAWLTAAGTAHVDAGSGLWFDTTPMVLEVAAQGGGVALGRSSMLEREITSGRLVPAFDLALAIEEGFFLVAPEKGARHPDAAIFRDWLRAEAKISEIL